MPTMPPAGQTVTQLFHLATWRKLVLTTTFDVALKKLENERREMAGMKAGPGSPVSSSYTPSGPAGRWSEMDSVADGGW